MELNNIKAHAFGDTHDIALSLIKDLERGCILDIAAGEGRLSYRLLQMGFQVTAADIEIGQFKLNQIKCDQLDLNDKLKYEDETFDYIMCIETFEHLRNPGICLDEFQRILKPRGVLILSAPNVTSLVSRIIFLLSGQYSNFYNTNSSCIDINKRDRHIMPLPLWLLKYHLKRVHFKIEKVKYSNGGFEIPTKKRPWKKLVFLPHGRLFGNSVVIKAQKSLE